MKKNRPQLISNDIQFLTRVDLTGSLFIPCKPIVSVDELIGGARPRVPRSRVPRVSVFELGDHGLEAGGEGVAVLLGVELEVEGLAIGVVAVLMDEREAGGRGRVRGGFPAEDLGGTRGGSRSLPSFRELDER